MSTNIFTEKLGIAGQSEITVAGAYPTGFRPGETPALVLAPGAGSDLRTPLLVALEEALAPQMLVLRFNFPYREAGRRAPDPQKKLEATYRAVLAWLRQHPELRPGRMIAGGKSMGGRIATHVVSAGEALDGLVLLGYPLHPPGQPAKLRVAHLTDIRCPLLFVQGSRDALCRLDLLAPTLITLGSRARLVVIDEGDHSFKVTKRSGRSEHEVFAEIGARVREFVLDPGGRLRG